MDFGLVGQPAIVAGKWACEYPKSKEIEPDKAWEASSLFAINKANENVGMPSFVRHKRWPKTLILLITPPPIDEDERLRHPYAENPSGLPERTNEAAGAFAKACVETAGECGIPVVDLWTRMQQYPDWRKAYLRDGLHLTQDGNKVVFEEVVKKLNVGGLSLEKLTVDLPLLADIDQGDPLKAFQW
ncbi:GDSL lipase/esterase - like 10 [Theobroma cacao]|nr:GDSL lipase/esterase - like 10 [Theobroma cacao]